MSRSDWQTKPMADVAEIVMGQSPSSIFYNEEGKGLPFIQGCAQFGSSHPDTGIYCTQPNKIARQSSVLISVRAPVGDINFADQDYCIGRGVAGIQGREVITEYLRYYLSHFQGLWAQMSQGSTFEAVNSKQVAAFPIGFPESRAEQTQIAEVLATVDRALAATAALIAKHERIKTGLMQDLLSRGLDERGQLRDPQTHRFQPSPLGDIPEEWEIVTIDDISQRITSGSRGWAKYYAEDGAKFVRIGNLTRHHLNLRWDDTIFVQLPHQSEGQRTRLFHGDLLISITADLGIIGVVPEDLGEAYINQHIALVKLDREKVNPWFIGHFLAAEPTAQRFLFLNDAGAKAGLNLPSIAKFEIVLPKKAEQDQIVAQIQAIENLIASHQTQLSKMQRLKTGLMADLLSGRVPVAALADLAL